MKKYSRIHEDREPICAIVFPIADFNMEQTPVGMFKYPFRMQIPTWLPPSLLHVENGDQLQINYELVAEYSPESLVSVR
jgi:hypothetical protein